MSGRVLLLAAALCGACQGRALEVPAPPAYPLAHPNSGAWIYALGGVNGETGLVAAVDAYDPAKDAWTTVTDLPTPRTGVSVVVGHDGRIYVIGGSPEGQSLSQVDVYDVARDRWSSAAPMSVARASASATLGSDGRIWVFDGWNPSEGHVTEIEVYDPAADAWTTVGSSGGADGQAAATGADGLLYVFDAASDGPGAMDSVDAFDPTRVAPVMFDATVPGKPLTEFDDNSTSDGGDLIYVAGVVEDAVGDFQAALDGYDPTQHRWPLTTPLPTARTGMAIATGSDGRVYVLGGAMPEGPDLTAVEVYDPSTGAWASAAPMPAARSLFAAAAAAAPTSR